MADSAASAPTSSILDEVPRRRLAIGHQDAFASQWNTQSRLYRSFADEAHRDQPENARKMLLDAQIRALLTERILPSTSLQFQVTPDDPKDEAQKKVAERYTKVIEATPRIGALKRYLQAGSLFMGKYGAQVGTDWTTVDGRRTVAISEHEPWQGDKINWDWDGIPAVLVRSTVDRPDARFRWSDRGGGKYLMLDTDYWRDRWIIQESDPIDRDFLFEADMAGQVHGEGLRSLLYFPWYMREQLKAWELDAVQRMGVNGMIYAFCDSGNPADEEAVLKALSDLVLNNVAVFKRVGGVQQEGIQNIPASPILVEVIRALKDYFDDQIRLLIVGQSLSSETGATGMGSGVAEFHRSTKEALVRTDVERLGETFTWVLAMLVRANGERLPFKMRVGFLLDRQDRQDTLNAALVAQQIGMVLDIDQLREESGFKAPTDDAHALHPPGAMAGAGGPSDGKTSEAMPGPTSPAIRLKDYDRDAIGHRIGKRAHKAAANYAAEHAPRDMTVDGKAYRGGEFIPAAKGSRESGGVAEVAPHHRKVEYREVPRVARTHPDRPLALDEGDDATRRQAAVLTEWRVAGHPAAMVVHDPRRGHAYAAGGEHDDEEVDEAHARPYSVLSPFGDGHDVHGHHPTREAAESQAREVARDAREAEGVNRGDEVIPAGDKVGEHLPTFDHSTHEVKLRERRPSRAELQDLGERDRDDWMAEHDARDFPDKAAYLAVMKAHVAGRMPPR